MAYDPEKVTLFAETDARGKHTPFGIKAKDRQRHVYVIGKTGMGKSTMLENMAIQDIQDGSGVAFIDPHGATAEKLLDFIPEHRKDDVLYFAPHDMEYPVSFNIMEDVGPDKRHLVVSGLMSVFEKIWVDAWSARMAYILQNTLMALLEYPDSTLLGVNRMLSDKNYRQKVVDNVKDPGVRSFWVDEFAKYNERYMQEAGDAIKNKIGQFTANPVIRNIVGQPKSSFDIRKIIDEKKIIIMNLSKGLIGEMNANLLGSMLTTRIYLAAMSRADLPPAEAQQMPNFFFYVDEFQSFANATFASILSEARKYKLNLTIAHQYIEQMEEEVRDAVFGNVGTIVSFRVGPFDAEVLETLFAPQFTATDIVNLGFAQIYLTLMIDGIGSPPFSAVTLPPIDTPSVSCKEIVIASSRQQFAKNRASVEAAVAAFHEPIINQEKQGQFAKKQGSENRGGEMSPNKPSSGWSRDQKQERERPKERPSENAGGQERSADARNSGSKQRPKEQNRKPHPPKEKNLEELRQTLRSIAGNDNQNSSPPKQVVAQQQRSDSSKKEGKQTQPKEQNDHSDLKAALAGALTGRESQKSEQKVEMREGAEAAAVSLKAKLQQPPKSPQESQPNISPKVLERMMRVTTSDKPPPQ